MTGWAIAAALCFGFTPSVPASLAQPVTLTFTIVNDTQQRQFNLEAGAFFFSPPDDFIQRDNVRLRGWYSDATLMSFHDFDLPINQDTTLYARWDYLNPALGTARLTPSLEGDRFASKTMTLRMPLYAPLAEDVRFQWQAAPMNSNQFDNIGGANKATFSPFRNGTFQYRLRYRIPIYSEGGTVIDTVSYYSETVTLTIYGQQTILGYIIGAGLICLVGLIIFLRRKRRIDYVVDGGSLTASYFHIGEDITLLPKAKRKGYRFIGWYEDEARRQPVSRDRMPLTSFKLYAKFKKTKTTR